jgi:protoporphyrinogen oxidase
LPKYVTTDDAFWSVSDEEAELSFLDGLMKIYLDISRDDVLAFKISRVKHVLAISTLNYSDHLPPMTTSVPGVHIVNSAHIVNGTLNVNETVGLAEAAIADLMAAEGRPTSAAALAVGKEEQPS